MVHGVGHFIGINGVIRKILFEVGPLYNSGGGLGIIGSDDTRGSKQRRFFTTTTFLETVLPVSASRR